MSEITNPGVRRGFASLQTAMTWSVAALLAFSIPARGDSIVTTDAFLPGARVIGASGVFRTDVEIFNPEERTTAMVSVYFALSNVDGTVAPKVTFSLSARRSITLDDTVLKDFGYTNAFGLLEVRSSVPVIVTSNIYNVAGSQPGTYGQFSPGQPYRKALGFDNSFLGDLYVIGLRNDPGYRVNATVMNPSSVPLEAGISLVDDRGFVYGTIIRTVPPFSIRQVDNIFENPDAFATFAPPRGGPYRLTFFVNLNNGARILSYATVNDRRTGDPYLITGEPMGLVSSSAASAPERQASSVTILDENASRAPRAE